MSNFGKCPSCGCEYFITEPNRYDVLKYTENGWDWVRDEPTDDVDTYYCKDCGEEILEEDLKKQLGGNE